MSGSCNLMDTAKTPVVYTVRDAIKGIKYYFIQPLETSLISLFENLSKSNSKTNGLSTKQKELLSTCYPNDDVLSKLEADVRNGNVFIIIPYFLEKSDSIIDIKRKLMNAIGYYYNDIHLWADVTVSDNRLSKTISARYGNDAEPPNTFTSFKYLPNFDFLECNTRVSLGIYYESSVGIELLDPNPKNMSPDQLAVNVINTDTMTLGYYNIKKNEINMMDFNSYREKHPEETDKNLAILRHFFPKSNEEPEFQAENSPEVIRIINKSIELSKAPIVSPEENIKIGTIGFNNIVIQVNRPANIYRKSPHERDINLLKIFEKLELSENIPYIRYRDIDRKYFTRIASDKLVNVYHDGVKVELNKKYKTTSGKYLQDYLPGLKPTNVSKTDMKNWSSTAISYRERQQLNRDREISDSNIDSNIVSELLLKVKLNPSDELSGHPFITDNYLTLVIKRSGHVYIKFIENKGDLPFDLLYCSHLNSIIPVIAEINTHTKDKVALFLPERPSIRNTPTNMEYTTFDANIHEIMTIKPVSFKKLADDLRYLVPKFFDFRVIRDTDTIKMKFSGVDNFQNFSNIKNHFLKLREVVKSAPKLMETFLLDCENIFNLTQLEATKLIEIFREEITTEPNVKPNFYADLDIEIELKRLTDTLFTSRITSCSSLENLHEINKELEKYFLRCQIDKSKSVSKVSSATQNTPSDLKIELTKIVLPQKKRNFVEHDASELMEESDLDDFSDSEEEFEDEEAYPEEPLTEGDDSGGGEAAQNKTNKTEEELDEGSISKLMDMETKTMRQFMPALRKAIDPRMYIYPRTNEHEQYSRLCAAVDNRQPMILTPDQWLHFERTNPDSFNSPENIYLRWGSDKFNMNYYICPRIFCFNKRCMMPLTIEQLLESDGKCFNCQSGIILDNTITSTSTVFVRRGQKKKYWAETGKRANADIVRLKKKYPDKWALYLSDTEKFGIPGFIDPKSHPENLCMPCCYSSNEPTNIFNNTDKCVEHNVDYYIVISTTKKAEVESFIKTLRADSIITIRNSSDVIDYTLKTGDQILISAGKKYSGVFKINETDSEQVKTFTDREISREFPNMTFNILIDSSNGYRRVKLTTKMEINEEKSLTDDSDYIINWNRRPIGHLRKGKLPEILNTLFANNLEKDIKKGRLEEGARRVVLREGTANNSKNSFISAIGHTTLTSPRVDLSKLLEIYIRDLTLTEFLDANDGDLVLQFAPNLDDEDFSNYLVTENYDEFINFLKLNRDLLKYNPSEITSKTKLKELVETDRQTRYNFILFHSFEFFKKYLGDQNIYKDYKILWNMFSKKMPYKYLSDTDEIEYKRGNNILILEYSRDAKTNNERVKLLTPLYRGTIIDTPEAFYTVLFKFTDTFTGDEYFETLYVDEYLSKNKLNSKTLSNIPEFLHKLIRELTIKCIEFENPSLEGPPEQALIMGKSIKDHRAKYIETEKLLKSQLGEPSMRVYEDHELEEFINDFFSRNRNIFASVKYTYPLTLEMYPDESMEEEYKETPGGIPEPEPEPEPEPPVRRKVKKKTKKREQHVEVEDNSIIPAEFTGPHRDYFLKGSMNKVIKNSKKLKPVIDQCAETPECLGVTKTGTEWSARTSNVLKPNEGDVSYVKGKPLRSVAKKPRKTVVKAPEPESPVNTNAGFLNLKTLKKKSKKTSGNNSSLKKTVKLAVDKASGFDGPKEGKYLEGPIKGDTTGLIEQKMKQCLATPECGGITSTRPWKEGKKFKMRTGTKLEDSEKGEISYVKKN